MFDTIDELEKARWPTTWAQQTRLRASLRWFRSLPHILDRLGLVLLCARYSLAVVLVAIAVGATLTFENLGLDQDMTHFGFYVVVVVIASARFAGGGPAALSIALSTIVGWLIVPRPATEQLPWLGAVIMSALVALSWDTERRRAEGALRRERDELEAEVQERTAELERALRIGSIAELISVTHEISQPLTGISTNARAAERWLVQDPPAVERVRACLSIVSADVGRASDVLDRVRAFSGQHALNREPTAINDVIRQALAIAQSAVERQGVLVSTELSTALPLVIGDPVQLQQVLLNLVNNAVEAMNLSTDRLNRLRIRSQIDPAGDVAVEIDDTGIGIDSAAAEKMFQKFFTTKPAGLGMGLPISRSIVEAHGGRLWASVLDRGTRFQFTLPAAGPRKA